MKTKVFCSDVRHYDCGTAYHPMLTHTRPLNPSVRPGDKSYRLFICLFSFKQPLNQAVKLYLEIECSLCTTSYGGMLPKLLGLLQHSEENSIFECFLI